MHQGPTTPDLEWHTLRFPGDMDTDYKHLPIRVFKLWQFLGHDWSEECDWYMKADADTYVNLLAMSERLSCFNSAEPHYLGVLHASMPSSNVRKDWSAMFFAHGGSGYVVSRGLIRSVGDWSIPCLAVTMQTTQGNAMEDVAFAACLRSQGVAALSYGFLSDEIVVNFHQARSALLNCSAGELMRRSPYWDAQPPPLHSCLLVAHPLEDVEGMIQAHALIERHQDVLNPPVHWSVHHGWEPIGQTSCVPSPMRLARQYEIVLGAHGGIAKRVWATEQLGALDICAMRMFVDNLALTATHNRTCNWKAEPRQCNGLSHYPPAISLAHCAESCCRSKSQCGTFQFKQGRGCWLGEANYCELLLPATDSENWEGGVVEQT